MFALLRLTEFSSACRHWNSCASFASVCICRELCWGRGMTGNVSDYSPVRLSLPSIFASARALRRDAIGWARDRRSLPSGSFRDSWRRRVPDGALCTFSRRTKSLEPCPLRVGFHHSTGICEKKRRLESVDRRRRADREVVDGKFDG